MSRKIKQQAVVVVNPITVDKIPEGIFQLPVVGVFNGYHVKTVFFQCPFHFCNVVFHARQIRPTIGVIAHAYYQSMALLVERRGLPVYFDVYVFKAALLRHCALRKDQQHD